MDREGAANDLTLPALLTELLREGRWRHPGDDALHHLMPWFESPLAFLNRIEWIRSESRTLTLFTDDPRSSQLFRELRGSASAELNPLTWLDVEQAVLIAVNR